MQHQIEIIENDEYDNFVELITKSKLRNLCKMLPYILNKSKYFKALIVHGSQYSLCGLERVFCYYSSIENFKDLIIQTQNQNQTQTQTIKYSLLELLKNTLLFRKYSAFFLLIPHLKQNKINHLFTISNTLSKTKSTATLLSISATQGFLSGTKKLLELGANINQFIINHRNEQVNILMSIVSNRNYNTESQKRQKKILKTMIHLIKKLDVNWLNNLGKNSLMVACQTSNYDFVRVLVSYGKCNINIIDNYGLSALDYLMSSIPNFGVLDSGRGKILDLLQHALH